MTTRPPASAIVAELEQMLRAAGVPARAIAEKRYLKSDLDFFGASVPAVRAAVRAMMRAQGPLDRATLHALADELWAGPVFEQRRAAVELLVALRRLLDPADTSLVERLVRTAKTWALVDPLAIDVAGSLAERYPAELGGVLDRWAVDPDFWVRRLALLALLPPLRRGQGDFDRFARYADAMLDEREHFIAKAIGWLLREVGKQRPDLVYTWLEPRIERASGVTMREAVKYLRPEQHAALMEAYRARLGGT